MEASVQNSCSLHPKDTNILLFCYSIIITSDIIQAFFILHNDTFRDYIFSNNLFQVYSLILSITTHNINILNTRVIETSQKKGKGYSE